MRFLSPLNPRQKHSRFAAGIPPNHQQDVSHGTPRRVVCAVRAPMERAKIPRGRPPPRPRPCLPHAVAQTHPPQHDATAQTKLLERVLKLRQGEALLLLDDGLLFHNLDINRIPAEPLHDVLVDPGRRR